MELLAAWGYALKQSGGDDAKAKEFITQLFKNVPVLDSGARGATTTFVERGIGDVLINWENEILLGGKDLGKDKFDIVVPPISILAEPTVSLVDKVVAVASLLTLLAIVTLSAKTLIEWKTASATRLKR